MLESYHKLQEKPKTVPEFKNTLQLICSVLLEKAIGSIVQDNHNWLQACVPTNGGHFEHLMW